ncbi:MAG: Entericidin EcnA/B family [Proteobacteria bacterium]|nr:Entericidin EcnA/B family [Pseudomonadota bacterium]
MKRLLIVALLSMFALSGCNTVHGFGQDLEKVGEKISGAASK